MTDLNHYFNSIDDSANSLKTLYFRPPGIFTNALISKPEITSLLRDADHHENTLYQVDIQGKPERKDGTRGVVDRLNDEFDEFELQQQINENENLPDPNANRPAVVPIPQEVEAAAPDLNKGVKNLLSRFNEESQDYDVDVLCETVRQLLEKYPIRGLEQELVTYKAKWEQLNSDIMQHEETIEQQRRQLSLLNVSLSDRELVSVSNTLQEPVVTRAKSAADLIVEEEEEIRQLEIELERKTRETEALLEASKR